MIGETVLHYRIISELGAGGMGVVYKAEDTRLGRIVALKFLPREMSLNSAAKSRLLNEARAASSLQHENICTIHAIDETPDGQLFICMDYYDGETVRTRLQHGPLSTDDAIDITTQVAVGLEAAHRQGVVHRDIKPENVFVTRAGVVKILDFGLSRLSGQTRVTKTGTIVGTIEYMSPEQVRGDDIDARTDIFSLGAMFYETLTGITPFHAEHAPAVMHKILNVAPSPLRNSGVNLSSELEPIVGRMLAKDASQRYERLEHTVRDLANLRQKKTRGQGPRRPGRVAVAVAAVIVLAASVMAAITLRHPAAKTTAIAVVGFENITDPRDTNRLGRMLVGLITTDLAETGGVPVVATSSVMAAVKQAGGDIDGAFDESLAAKVGSLTGAQTIVTGQVMERNGRIVLAAEMVDVESGRSVGSIKEEAASIESLFDLAGVVADRVRRHIGVSNANARNRSFDLAQTLTTSTAAYRQFVIGETALHQKRFADAASGFAAATTLDSTFALAWYREYFAYDWDGHEQEAWVALAAANRHKSRLPSDWQALIQATGNLAKRPDLAYGALRPLVESGQTIPEVYNQFGELCFHGSRFLDIGKSAMCFEKALDLDPFFKIVCYHLINAYITNGDTTAVNQLFVRLAKDDPADRMLDGRLHYLTYRREYAKARAELQRQWNAGHTTLAAAEAEALIDSGEYVEAVSRAATQVQRLSGGPRGGAQWGYISALLATGRFETAIATCDGMLKEPTMAAWWDRLRAMDQTDMAIMLSWVGDSTRQIEELHKGVAADYFAPEPRSYLIHALWRSGRHAEALAELDSLKAMRKRAFSPGNDCYVHLLAALTKATDENAVQTEFAAVDAQPMWNRDSTFESMIRSEILETRGDLAGAAAVYRDLLSKPRSGSGQWAGNGTRISKCIFEIPATFQLARLEDKLGHTAEARRLYGEFLSRWGNAVPQIEMVKTAKERMKAI